MEIIFSQSYTRGKEDEKEETRYCELLLRAPEISSPASIDAYCLQHAGRVYGLKKSIRETQGGELMSRNLRSSASVSLLYVLSIFRVRGLSIDKSRRGEE